MSSRRITLFATAGMSTVFLLGCASLDEHRQLQMAHRNLEAEKAQIESELYDSRNSVESLRSRTVSLEEQLAGKDLLIDNLGRENEGLEQKFGRAQSTLEKFAGQPLPPVIHTKSKLPAELDSALREFASANASSVVYDAANGTLKWTSDLLFELGSDVVKAEARGAIRSLSQIMRSPAASAFEVIVVGHTDNVPVSRPATRAKHPTNMHLSAHRAISVGNVLKSEGLEGGRVGVMGYGEFRPIAANNSGPNRSRNRRVELYIVPSGVFSSGTEVRAFTGQGSPAVVDDKTK